MVTKRMQKFDELIMREISKEIRGRFPNEFIAVTQVHVSKDLAFAKIWLSAVDDIDQVVKLVRAEASDIRKSLSRRIIARKVPSLYFVADKTEENAQHIEALLSEIKKEDK